jgi:hypothetical protein
MSAGIPPPPLNSPSGSYYWLEWYTNLTNILNGKGYPWTNLNFASSNITDIITRNHNDLQNIQGGFGTTQATGLHYHMVGVGFVDATAAAPKLPTGWSVVHTATGVYTITMPISLTPPNFFAGATSNTAGNVVQYINVSGTSSFVVNCTNSVGTTAIDTAFSFWVSAL